MTSQARMLAFSFGDHRGTERLDVRFTSEASVFVNDLRGVSVDRREERKRRRTPSAVSGSVIVLLE